MQFYDATPEHSKSRKYLAQAFMDALYWYRGELDSEVISPAGTSDAID
jgi:hypothetical protein